MEISYDFIVNDNALLAEIEKLIGAIDNIEDRLAGMSESERKAFSQLEGLAKQARQAYDACLLYTSPSPRDQRGSRMPSSA